MSRNNSSDRTSVRCLVMSLLITAVCALTASPAPATEPRPPVIVFMSARSGDGDLYGIRPGGGEPFPVVTTDAPEGAPRYDASRRRLLHDRFDPDQAMIMSGGDELFPDPNGEAAPVWSPTGDQIAYDAPRGEGVALFVADTDGSDARPVTAGRHVDRYPAWSPDGSRLVFARRLESGWDLHTVVVAGGEASVIRLTADARYVGHPAWSPDGRFIAYDTAFGEQTDIVMRELDSGAVTRLTERPGNDLAPAWAPDGRAVAFGGEQDGNWDVWLVDLAGPDLKRLTTDPAFDGAPVFVPEGVVAAP